MGIRQQGQAGKCLAGMHRNRRFFSGHFGKRLDAIKHSSSHQPLDGHQNNSLSQQETNLTVTKREDCEEALERTVTNSHMCAKALDDDR